MNPPSRRATRVPFAGLLVIVAACSPAPGGSGQHAARLQTILDSLVAANPTVPGMALYVADPRGGESWSGSAGATAHGGGEPLLPDHPVRIASTTKTYTAAAILRLAEDGRLGLDDPIALHLPAPYLDLLHRDGYQTDAITIRQVLSHTSGIFDYAFGPGSDYGDVALGDLSHRWTRREQVEFAIRVGDPLGPPGSTFHYSDTGYILLGEIIEQKTGEPLAAAFRRLLGFEQLGLRSTYLETLEPAPAGVRDRAHQYTGELDAFAADPSFDLYGGGGLVATVSDMGTFFAALLGGRVFRQPETLHAMLTVPPVSDTTGGSYGLGISRLTLGTDTCWGHGGFWGTLATVCLPSGVTIALAINQNEGTQEVRRGLLTLVARELGLVE